MWSYLFIFMSNFEDFICGAEFSITLIYSYSLNKSEILSLINSIIIFVWPRTSIWPPCLFLLSLYPCILGCWHKAKVISRNWQLPAKCAAVLSNPALLILCTNRFFLLRPKISQGGSVSQGREGHHVCSCGRSLKVATAHSPSLLCLSGFPHLFHLPVNVLKILPYPLSC